MIEMGMIFFTKVGPPTLEVLCTLSDQLETREQNRATQLAEDAVAKKIMQELGLWKV